MRNPRAYLAAHPECLLLYAVTDSAWLEGRSLADCSEQALAGGATFLQLREKNLGTDQQAALGRELQALATEYDVPFVIDDDVEAALRCDADGVHVGQEDMACASARRLLGPDKIVGVSAQTVEQALAAQRDGADYLGVGALFKTATKPEAADVTLRQLADICAAVTIPVVGIGGLNMRTIAQLAGSGAVGAAVVSAIFAAEDIPQATRQLHDLCAETFSAR